MLFVHILVTIRSQLRVLIHIRLVERCTSRERAYCGWPQTSNKLAYANKQKNLLPLVAEKTTGRAPPGDT